MPKGSSLRIATAAQPFGAALWRRPIIDKPGHGKAARSPPERHRRSGTRRRARPVELARLVAQGGATLVPLRRQESDTRPMIEAARATKAALPPLGVPFVVNDRVAWRSPRAPTAFISGPTT